MEASAFNYERVTVRDDGTEQRAPETFEPTGSRVLVRLDPKCTMTPGQHGKPLHIPPEYQRMPWWGEVVAVGPGRWREDGVRDMVGVQTGDRVGFGCWNGIRMDEQLGIRDGRQYWLMEQWKRSFGWDAPDLYLVQEGE